MKLSEIKILTLVLVVFTLSSFVFAQPKAVVHPMQYDFGDIIQDSIVTTNFVITNEGSNVLKITKVNAHVDVLQ